MAHDDNEPVEALDKVISDLRLSVALGAAEREVSHIQVGGFMMLIPMTIIFVLAVNLGGWWWLIAAPILALFLLILFIMFVSAPREGKQKQAQAYLKYGVPLPERLEKYRG